VLKELLNEITWNKRQGYYSHRCSRGVGNAVAIVLTAYGIKVVVVSRATSEVNNTVEKIRSSSNKVIGIIRGISKEDEARSIVKNGE